MGFTPSSGKELQSEFFIPINNAVDAILALEKKRAEIGPELEITEIRSIAADALWMSPCYRRDCITIHFTWKQHSEAVMKLIAMIEQELMPFGVIPHWGKLFTLDPNVLHSRYSRFSDFLKLAKNFDPEGKFKNAFLERNIYTT